MYMDYSVLSFINLVEGKQSEELATRLSEEKYVVANNVRKKRTLKDIFATVLASNLSINIYDEMLEERLCTALIKSKMISHKIGSLPILHRAVLEGNHRFVKILLRSNADPNERCDNNYTPLMYAAMDNQKQCALYLLETGAAVNAMDKRKWTPLFHAIGEKRHEMAELLIKNKADLSHTDVYDWSPLLYIALLKDVKMATIYHKYNTDNS